ncbi:MAG: hypothetical protein ACR2P6_06635 [Gammaproteobacteria bacterium]
MRTSLQPLAHLVDAAAEKWLAVEHAPESEQLPVREDITHSFRIGDNPELTFHGLRFLLIISQDQDTEPGQEQAYRVEVHEIALNS